MNEPIWIDEAVVLAIHDRQLVEHDPASALPSCQRSRSLKGVDQYTYMDDTGLRSIKSFIGDF